MKEGSFYIKFLEEKYPATYIKSPSLSVECFKKLQNQPQDTLYGIDIETAALPMFSYIKDAALSPHLSQIRLLQLFDGKEAYLFDFYHIPVLLELEDFLKHKRLVAHNAVFELMFLKKLGNRFDINITCSQMIAKLLLHAKTSEDIHRTSLENLVRMMFKTELLKTNQTSNWAEGDLTFEQVEYAALDAVATLKLAEKLAPQITHYGLNRIYKLSKDALHPIADMQLNGLGFNVDRHRELIPEWRKNLYEAKKRVLEVTGLTKLTSFTIAEWLEKNLDAETLALWPKTDGGKLSTDAKTLADFDWLPIVEPFSEYQRNEKLCTTYGMQLIEQVNPATLRLHAGYNLCGARTGRLSSNKPNLQNLPARGIGKSIRENFIPAKGFKFICADLNQVELRVAAEVSQDPQMVKAYKEGLDLHALTAATIANKSLECMTDEERDLARFKAKAFNFGLLFGLGPTKFSKYAKASYKVEVTQEEAEESIAKWRELYAVYREWQLAQAEAAKETLCTRTPCGKLRKLNEENYYGASMNTPVQGGAAEVMLYILCRLRQALKPYKAFIVNVVHDEVLVEVHESQVDQVMAVVCEAMIQGYQDVFPKGLTHKLVKANVGNSWADAK